MGDYHTITCKYRQRIKCTFPLRSFSIPLILPPVFPPSLSPSHPPFSPPTLPLSSKILPAGGPNGTSSPAVGGLSSSSPVYPWQGGWSQVGEGEGTPCLQLCPRQQPHHCPELTEETPGNIPSLKVEISPFRVKISWVALQFKNSNN